MLAGLRQQRLKHSIEKFRLESALPAGIAIPFACNRAAHPVHGSSIAQRQNYLDLDPTYRDAWGQPLLRMTFDFPQNDIKMAAYVTAKALEVGKAMGTRKNDAGQLMRRVAERLSDADIAAVSGYFASATGGPGS
jgi:hypothetical protein